MRIKFFGTSSLSQFSKYSTAFLVVEAAVVSMTLVVSVVVAVEASD